jgi:hypothetical protein
MPRGNEIHGLFTWGRIRRIIDLSQTVVFLLTALAGIGIGVVGSFYSVEKIALNLIVVLLGLMSLNLSIERLLVTRRIERLEEGDVKTYFEELPLEVRPHVLSCIRFCSQAYRLRRAAKKEEERGFPEVVDKVLSDQYQLLEGLSEGWLKVPNEHTAIAQRALTNLFRERFDAISQSDLDFWLGNSPIAREYFDTNVASIKRGAAVNRIFVFTQLELVRRGRDIVEVLTRQDRAGIGWGVAVQEELENDVVQSGWPLDFGLFNVDRAVSLFRKQGEQRFEAIFSTPTNKDRIQAHKELYAKLIAECWVVNARFKESFIHSLSTGELQMVLSKAGDSNLKLRQLLGEEVVKADPFVLEVKGYLEVGERLTEFVDLLRKFREGRGLEMPSS